MTTLRVLSASDVPDLYGSLGVESRLLDEGPGEDPALFLWRSPSAVVMGKNQNPWTECNLHVVRERGLRLARRETGGGSVYHDPGNLNVCWAMPRILYRPERLHHILVDALAREGVEAEARKGGAVWAGRRKISGCAYGYRRERVLHHATLLVDADLALLKAALAPPRIRVRTHAVPSVPAPVANLSALRPEVTVDTVAGSLLRSAAEAFGEVEALSPSWLEGESTRRRAAEMASAEWIWWRTPRFRIRLEIDGRALSFEVHKGHLEKVDWAGHAVATTVRFDRDSLRGLDRALGLSPGCVADSLQSEGWWLPK